MQRIMGSWPMGWLMESKKGEQYNVSLLPLGLLTIWSKHPSALHPHGLHVVEVGLIRRPRRHLAVVDNRVPVRRRGDDQVDRLRGPARHDFGSVAADDLVEAQGGRVTSPLGPVPAHPFGGRHHSKSEARSPCVRHAGHVTKGD